MRIRIAQAPCPRLCQVGLFGQLRSSSFIKVSLYCKEYRKYSLSFSYHLFLKMFWDAVSGEIYPGGQEYRSMAGIEDIVVSVRKAARTGS